MLTKHEMRVLYTLKKYGGHARHSQISQAMHRVDAKDRDAALSYCETMELISSAKTPVCKGRGGSRGGLVYWLTAEGIDYVQGAIDSNDMIDPALQRQGVKLCG